MNDSTSPSRSHKPIVIWCITDGKAGHLNQMIGLTDAMARHLSVDVHTIDAMRWYQALGLLLGQSCPDVDRLPAPDLILGAGHRTHLSVLAVRRACGGRAVVLMKPTLPARWFDLCLVPAHDEIAASESIVLTRGVLNKVQPSSQQQADRGLILLGGPSAHHDWNDVELVEEIRLIVTQQADKQWQLTTSRRTPASVLPLLEQLEATNLQVTPLEQTDPQWVPSRLAESSVVWVSEDSVSMVYEALTSGAAVGLLTLPRKRESRVCRGLDDLARDELVTRFDLWRSTDQLHPPAEPLWEADRCARLLIERFAWR